MMPRAIAKPSAASVGRRRPGERSLDDPSFGYRDQLTGADRAGTANDESYTYDASGNRQTVGGVNWTTTANNQLAFDGTYAYAYDNEGNRVSRSKTGEYVEYAWDHRNRLAKVETYGSPAKTTLLEKVEYLYDAFDRRIAKVHDANGATAGGLSSEYFVYDGPNVVMDLVDSDGPGGSATAQVARRYLHGPLVDQVLAQENVSGGSVTGVLWMLADNQGTVRDLLNNSGQHVEHIAYDSFGSIKGVADGGGTPISGPSTRYAYTGREWDSAVDMYYYRARYYDAAIGRFASEDPIGFAGGDYNLSRYVGNNSTNLVDPTGFAGQTATLPASLSAHIARMIGEAAKISPVAYDKAVRESLLLVGTLYGMNEAGQFMSQVSGRCLDDILNNKEVLDRWLKHKFPADKPFSNDDATKIWNKLKELGQKIRLDDGHPGTKWPGRHINSEGPGGIHIPVEPGFTPPP